jgi:hypothetical protein
VSRDRLSRRAVLAIPALLGALVVLWATGGPGPGTEGDTADYVCAAQIFLARGALCDCGGTWPLIHFPPLYPVMLASGIRLGLAPLTAARYIAAGSCAASVLMAGALLEAMSSSMLLALLGEILLLWTVGISMVFLYALTEAPFDVFLLLFVWCLWRALDDVGVKWIVAAGVAAVAAALTRYVGVSLLATGASALVCLGARPLSERIRRACVFIAIGVTPVAAWFIRNHLETRSIGRPVDWHPPGGGYFFSTCGMVARWFFPTLSSERGYWFGALVLIVIVTMLIALELRSSNRLKWIMTNVILSYGATLMLVRALMDMTIWINRRMLAPILLIALLLALHAIRIRLARRDVGARAFAIVIGLVLTILVVNSGPTAALAYESRVRGLGFTRRPFSQSDTILRLRRLAADTPIYSDAPEPIILFADRLADNLPQWRDQLSGRPAPRYRGELATMQNRLRDRPGVIAYFYEANAHVLDNIPSLAEMPAAYGLSMTPLLSAPEGQIFEARTLPTVRSAAR